MFGSSAILLRGGREAAYTEEGGGCAGVIGMHDCFGAPDIVFTNYRMFPLISFVNNVPPRMNNDSGLTPVFSKEPLKYHVIGQGWRGGR